ncbi:Kinase A inhibitor [Rhodobacteraceae bacterium THAF1]|uniref:5-oxoprolinase subunit B family protein n=1 Tax=Palleronia sp. THAF1 TaxID=2587842 RepID=UPI000F3DA6C0|nr:carboxyltransferase domain-containing protein [Palleronia sp. THAF1]QFU07829.1 Kinase A inhibitor [Palleronia sp. THAF1]VDC25648.1 Kinase A inhibitor [Rhodobacteraceae bacterium THAF1]
MADAFPRFTPLGLDGLLVSFSDRLDEAANRAALAYGAALRAENWEGVTEVATSLASAFLSFDPGQARYDDLASRAETLAHSRDWTDATLPTGGRLFTIPACFEDPFGPDLADAARLAGVSPETAIAELCAEPLRALALGFAPGQAYLGELPDHWAIDRQTDLTRVETGAIVTAVQQVIVFATSGPTGWRQVGMTRFHGFRPDNADAPIALQPGDEIQLKRVGADAFATLSAPDGGATVEDIA